MSNKLNKPGKTFFIIAATILVLLVCGASCCKLIDNSEVGIKFKKFSLTEQGKLPEYNGGGALPFINIK